MRQKLLSLLASRVDREMSIPILQPADLFLDAGGEELRRRIYMSEDIGGRDLCLRPEFTIPICRAYLESDEQNAKRFSYGGTVFRQSRKAGNEFQQVGLEDLGNEDRIEADVACLSDLITCLNQCGASGLRFVLGDQDLFQSVIDSLQLPQSIAERLSRNFGSPDLLVETIDQWVAPKGVGWPTEQDRDSLMEDILSKMREGGLSETAGRSPQDIADRMIERAQLAGFRLDEEKADLLKAYLSIETGLMKAGEALTDFSNTWKVDFGDKLNAFEERLSRLLGCVDHLPDIQFQASFGRKLDYYSGMLFDVYAPGETESIAGGGRYDGLCTLLGSADPVPAVGFSLTLDRLRESVQ